MNGIGRAEITPRMAAGAAQTHAIAARAKRRMSDTLYARPIEADKGVYLIGPTPPGQKVSRATQIPLSLFAHSSDEEKRAFRLDVKGLKGAKQRDERGESATIVGNAR